MKYLVTGGSGFIGSNIVDFLVSTENEVIVIDNESSDAHDKFYYNLKATYYKHSVVDYDMCSEVFKLHKPDYVLHLAAEARIQNCIENPTKAYETNLMGTLNILALCKEYKVKRLVLSTTSAIYGLKNTGALHEEMPADCLNSYSLSKWNAEHACKIYSSMYGVDTVCLRYFNVYGPHQPIKGPYAPVIGIFSKQLLSNGPLTVVGDGEQTRDYIHVFDVVRANVMATKYQGQLNGEVFNVGTNKAYSVNEIAKKLSTNIKYLPPRNGEARASLANIEKIQNYFGWKPTIELMKWIDLNFK